jgi:hypothetical protein
MRVKKEQGIQELRYCTGRTDTVGKDKQEWKEGNNDMFD